MLLTSNGDVDAFGALSGLILCGASEHGVLDDPADVHLHEHRLLSVVERSAPEIKVVRRFGEETE